MRLCPIFLQIAGVLFVALATGTASREAWAKKVHVEWKPMPGALQYEIQIEQSGKTVAKKIFDETSWSGDLEPGFYVYQIRAYDRIKRPGKWAPYKPLVVMPKPPEAAYPIDGKKVVLFNAAADIPLKWNAVPGATSYRFELKREKEVVRTEITSATTALIKGLAAGNYTWSVTAFLEPHGRMPASFEGRKWESKPNEASEFKVELQRLAVPTLTSPLGKLVPPSDGRQRFKWKSVEGAEAYELTVYSIQLKGRAIASPSAPIAKLVTPESSIVVPGIPGEGHYRWRVRALANIDEKHVAQAVGEQSSADFNLDKNAGYFEGSGYIALSTMIAPYTYQVISGGATGAAGSSAITARVSGEYWLRPQWGVSGAVESTLFQLGDGSYNRKGFELLAKYRINFGDPKSGWSFAPKAGIEERDYFEIFPNGGSAATISSMVYGVDIGFDLRKQLTQKMSLGIKAAYFKPMILSSASADKITADASGRNMSVGAQALYWLNGHWGLGAGAYLEKRSISYTLKTPSKTGQPEQVFMDGTYFFGSVIYSFGR
jgi:hypothetical protein